MAFDLRLPNITGSTEREQLAQVKSYLYQLTEQLQWAINNVSSAPASYVVSQAPRSGASSSQATPFDAEVAFADLKPLIIKSADIVEAYYEVISKTLEGKYVARSDFGDFKQVTSQNILQSSTATTLIFESVQTIEGAVDKLDKKLLETEGYVKTGIIDQDNEGFDIIGVEIRQKNSADGEDGYTKIARFTSDRLSFYDQNGFEVGYISDYKLYITDLEVLSSIKHGGFQKTILANGDVVTKWVGRG